MQTSCHGDTHPLHPIFRGLVMVPMSCRMSVQGVRRFSANIVLLENLKCSGIKVVVVVHKVVVKSL